MSGHPNAGAGASRSTRSSRSGSATSGHHPARHPGRAPRGQVRPSVRVRGGFVVSFCARPCARGPGRRPRPSPFALLGSGGALVTANGGALIAGLFPLERSREHGLNGVSFSAGAVLGILLGGAFVTDVSWRKIFWINVSMGLVGVALALGLLRAHGTRQPPPRPHRRGHLRARPLRRGVVGDPARVRPPRRDDRGLTRRRRRLARPSSSSSSGGPPSPCCPSRSSPSPMTPSPFASLFRGLANDAVVFLVARYLQGARLTPIHASRRLIAGSFVGAVGGPAAGRRADRVSPVVPATLLLGVQVVAPFIEPTSRCRAAPGWPGPGAPSTDPGPAPFSPRGARR